MSVDVHDTPCQNNVHTKYIAHSDMLFGPILPGTSVQLLPFIAQAHHDL